MKRATVSADGETITVHIPMVFKKRGGRKLVVTPDGAAWAPRPRVDNAMVKALARALRSRMMRDSGAHATLQDLARAKGAGLVVKAGLVVGMGETDDEIEAALADLAGVGVDIVTIGQYLRPTTHHLPVARWVEPAAFERMAAAGEALGIGHVEASPLTRSSYHARQAAAAATPVTLRRAQ